MSEAVLPVITSHIPTISQFDPGDVPWQKKVLRDIFTKFDYSKGTHEVLLSGAVGSAKSLLLAHIIVLHVLMYPGAQVGIGRLTMPSLKRTILDVLKKHIGNEFPYTHRQQAAELLANQGWIRLYSWRDLNFEKFRSEAFSLFVIEELTETKDKAFYDEVTLRLGRLPHIPQSLIIAATNPDEPEHWAHNHFIESESPQVHVYYSRTEDNKFLPPSYVERLKSSLDPKMAERMLYGKWLSITKEVVYYQYARETNYKKTELYVPHRSLPIRISFDFNIGAGKPMSAVAFQYVPKEFQGWKKGFHWFKEFVVEGARTEDILEEMAGSGLLDMPMDFIVHGDASGRHNDTRSKKSDYDIIQKFLANYRTRSGQAVRFEVDVPKANPPVRKRHNLMNACMKNSLGEVQFFVYGGCKVLDEGLRLTKLRPGGEYVEDDSKHYQHITTAAGYGVVRVLVREERGESTMQEM